MASDPQSYRWLFDKIQDALSDNADMCAADFVIFNVDLIGTEPPLLMRDIAIEHYRVIPHALKVLFQHRNRDSVALSDRRINILSFERDALHENVFKLKYHIMAKHWFKRLFRQLIPAKDEICIDIARNEICHGKTCLAKIPYLQDAHRRTSTASLDLDIDIGPIAFQQHRDSFDASSTQVAHFKPAKPEAKGAACGSFKLNL